MTRVNSDQLAARLLAEGKGIDQVVDATALEPREVLAIAQRVKKSTPVRGPEFASLTDLADRVNSQALLAKYPRKAQTLLAKAADLIARAQDAVEEDAGKAALRARRDKLKAELAKVNAELRGHTGPVTSFNSDGVDSRAVRAWAQANNIDVPPTGRVKRDVVLAYLNATRQVAS